MTVSVPRRIANTRNSASMSPQHSIGLLRKIAATALEFAITLLIGLALTAIIANLPFSG